MASLLVMSEQNRRGGARLRRLKERELLTRQANLVDRDVADLGRVVAGKLGLDQISVRIDVDVGVDQIRLIGAGRRIWRGVAGWIGRQRRSRHQLVEDAFRLALRAVNL
jgi:hypothetical protein